WSVTAGGRRGSLSGPSPPSAPPRCFEPGGTSRCGCGSSFPSFSASARGPVAIGVCLVVAVFFGLGMAPVTGAISTELFPTYIRNQSAAWARNIFEISGIILGPLLVGTLGDHYTGALGSIGDTVSVLVLLFIPAVWLVWRHLPESKGRELEEIEAELGVAAHT